MENGVGNKFRVAPVGDIATFPPKAKFVMSISAGSKIELHSNVTVDGGSIVPFVRVSHYWDGHSWYRFDHRCLHDHIDKGVRTVTNAGALELFVRMGQGISATRSVLELYIRDHFIVDTHKDGETVLQICRDIEKGFLGIVGLGIMDFPFTQ